MQEGRELYKESAAAPDIRQTLPGWARLEEAHRKFDAAAAILDRIEQQWPAGPGVLLTRAVLLGRLKQADAPLDAALAVLDQMAQQAVDGRLGPHELAEKDGCSRWGATTTHLPRSPRASGSRANSPTSNTLTASPTIY
jgi:hypothetical protein